MKFDKEKMRLYAITDRHWLNGRNLKEVVKESLDGGVTFLQLRDKNSDDETFLQEAAELQELCRDYKVPLIINDNVEIALKMNADGVHVGQSDMEAGAVREKLGPDKILGVSARTVEQALLAQERGADYLGVGAVFATGSKADAAELPHETLKAICEVVSIPVVAIGGITAENISQLKGTGICGVAVISAIYAQNNIKEAAEELKEAVDKDLIHVIAEKLKQYKAENIVVDPVMVATSGAKLISDDAVEILKQELFPLADVLTPNIPEAEVLVEMSVTNAEEMIEAAGKISETYHCAVLCKGGHSINDANDLLYYDGKYCWFEGKRIDNPNTHGTGCTLSSAIASNLAKGYDLQTAVKRSKQYISGALAAMLDLGKGSGPMDHGFAIRNEYVKESEK